MKRRTFACLAASAYFMLCIPMTAPVRAESVDLDFCSILLCLPQGFPGSDCKPAKKLYRRLLKKRKPLPTLGECTVHPTNALPAPTSEATNDDASEDEPTASNE